MWGGGGLFIPSHSNEMFSHTDLQISPTTSSSMSSSHYAQSSSHALPIPSDFKLHVSADCAQNCRNTPGSYSCSCVSGYQLASDGKSCLGEKEITKSFIYETLEM